MDHPDQPAGPRVFDVLRSLEVNALDILYDSLRATGCIPSVRLACHALRDAVDGSVRHVLLAIPWEQRGSILCSWSNASPLARWPRCSSVGVSLAGSGKYNKCGVSLDCPPALLAWPFAGLPSVSLQRITRLSLSMTPLEETLSTDAVRFVAAHLPSLRHLELNDCALLDSKADNPQSTHHVYAVLANSCPQLESLLLPSRADLEGVGALSNSLLRLELASSQVDEFFITVYRHSNSLAIAQLTRLTDLLLEKAHFGDLLSILDTAAAPPAGERDFLAFLNHLPPLLRRLRLRWVGIGTCQLPKLDAALSGGLLTAVEVGGGVECRHLAYLVSLLLASKVLGPRLARLQLDRWLSVTEGCLRGQSPLRQLLLRCDQVAVQRLRFGPGETFSAVVAVAQMLGCLPGVIDVKDGYLCLQLPCRRNPGAGNASGCVGAASMGTAAAASGCDARDAADTTTDTSKDTDTAVVATQPAAPGSSSLGGSIAGCGCSGDERSRPLCFNAASAEDLVAAALERWCCSEGCRDIAGDIGGDIAGGSAGASDGDGFDVDSHEWTSNRILLLRGPTMDSLVRGGCLHPWLTSLAGAAASGPAAPEAACSLEMVRHPVAFDAYLVTQTAGEVAVLLQCDSELTAHAASAAVVEVHGSRGGGDRAMILEGRDLACCMQRYLSQVVQELWDAREPGCGTSELTERLERLGQWSEELKHMLRVSQLSVNE